jgi:pyridoxine kinase
MAILSIQSHVAYGYVGNRVASFSLERMGLEIMPINTVQLSNHTGYPKWRGQFFEAIHLFEVTHGLQELGVLNNCKAILSGYMGDLSTGKVIAQAVGEVKLLNPKAIYCCDPVIGDIGHGIFVRKGIPEFFMEELIPRANIITPNFFEAQFIAGMEINNFDDVRKACYKIHVMGAPIILITSYMQQQHLNEINILLSFNDNLYMITTPYLPFTKHISGCGDLFSALFLGNYLIHKDPVTALEQATSSVFAIMSRTFTDDSIELRLIQAQENIINPTEIFKAVKIN